MPSISPSLSAAMAQAATAVTETMERILPKSDFAEQKLFDAMRYGVLNGGKRLRPFLVLNSAALFGVGGECALRTAAAVECLHSYSLIHDDLPAMDDDDLRRGKPSNHKVFGEALAILAGDALLTDAFGFMARTALPSERVLAALRTLAEAAGSRGMVGGQVLDMAFADGRDPASVSLPELQAMHRGKTGALFRAACVSGAQLAGAAPERLAALTAYGEALGLAFQIVDDILDVTQDTATLGKPAGSDAASGKITYPVLMGIARSRELAAEAAEQAVVSLAAEQGPDAAFLTGLARLLVHRIN